MRPSTGQDSCRRPARVIVANQLLHIAGFAGKEAQVPTVVKMAVIDDTQALRRQLFQWAEIESLKRIPVSHGSPIDENPRLALHELADTLA